MELREGGGGKRDTERGNEIRKSEENLFSLLLNLLGSCKHIQFLDDIGIIFYWIIASQCVCFHTKYILDAISLMHCQSATE